jgi:hypothetical protein
MKVVNTVNRKDTNGTSFHGHTIRASVKDLIAVCGEPLYVCNDHYEKVQYEWVLETNAGDIFTIYDWKEYRFFDESEIIEWHIGAHNGLIASDGLLELAQVLNQ